MLHSLRIQECFTHKDTTIDFNTGLTAITGVNGSGKSLIVEMIRFSLFGVDALRTEGGDYKGAKSELAFAIRGVNYAVKRSIKNATLYREGDVLVTGTRPVNLKIAELFGYGLKVFDTANVANQGKIEELSAMKPSERKRLVDTTIGLNVLDDLAKWCADEVQIRRKEADTIENTLTVPVVPVMPPDYEVAEILQKDHDNLMELDRERRKLEYDIATEPAKVEFPVETVKRTTEELIEDQHKRQEAHHGLVLLVANFARLTAPTLSQTEVEDAKDLLARYTARQAAGLWLIQNPAIEYTEDDLDKVVADIDAYDRWKAWTEMAKKGSTTCPACNHSWYHKAHEMETLGDWKDKEPPKHPAVNSLLVIEQMRRKLEDYKSTLELRTRYTKELEEPSVKPTYTLAEIQKAEAGLATAKDYIWTAQQIEAAQAALDAMPDVSGDIRVRAAYEKALRAAHVAAERWGAWRVQVPVWEARLGALAHVPWALARTVERLVAARTYAAEMTRYERDRDRYVQFMGKVTALRTEVVEYTAAREALMLIKSKVKSYLVPSLSRVASMVLTQMTAGALSQVVVDEEFDITVDGIKIDGLSGAGKAAANLALRFGLGQVLTNKVFSVFVADEIDASMDADRAQYVAECLRNLTKNISQIILVTHKTPDADNYIRL